MSARIWRRQGGVWRRPGEVLADPFILGTTMPDETNTGNIPGIPLTNFDNGGAAFTAGTGTTYENVRFNCWVNLGGNPKFRNCHFGGPVSGDTSDGGSGRPLVYATSSSVSGAEFDRCTFRPHLFGPKWGDGIMGHDYKLIRCNVSGGVDGIGTYRDPAQGTDVNVLTEGAFIHDLSYWAPTTTQSDRYTHNDGNQHHGGRGVRHVGSRISGFCDPTIGNIGEPGVFENMGTNPPSGNVVSGNVNDRYSSTLGAGNLHTTSVFMLNQGGSSISTDIEFEDSWVEGGVVGLNTTGISSAFTPSVSFLRTRFRPPMHGWNRLFYMRAGHVLTVTDCVRWDTPGTAVDGSGTYRTNLA